MSTRGETFVSEDVLDAILDRYPEMKGTDFSLRPTTPIVAYCDDQIPKSFSVEMIDDESGEVIARFDVKVKFAIEKDFVTRYVVVSGVSVNLTWSKAGGEVKVPEREVYRGKTVHVYSRAEAIDSIVESLADLSEEEILSIAESLMREHLSGLSGRKLEAAYEKHFGSQIKVRKAGGAA